MFMLIAATANARDVRGNNVLRVCLILLRNNIKTVLNVDNGRTKIAIT